MDIMYANQAGSSRAMETAAPMGLVAATGSDLQEVQHTLYRIRDRLESTYGRVFGYSPQAPVSHADGAKVAPVQSEAETLADTVAALRAMTEKVEAAAGQLCSRL